jgi:secreted trypsin-like serine protease
MSALLRLRVLLISLTMIAVLGQSPFAASAIKGGQPDNGAHPFVGMVYNDEIFCSGTLISPTVFLTAGHCTAEFEAGGSQVYVTFAENADFDPANAVTGTAFTHPLFCIQCGSGLPGFDAYDVGVVVLDTAVTNLGFGQLPLSGVVDDLEKGTLLTAVGYGVRSFERGGGPPQAAGIADRYRADVKFTNVTNVIGEMFIKHSNNKKGGACFGDSGGPIFAPDQVTVLGVTAFGAGLCTSQSYAQRVDRPDVLEWIAQFL